MGTKRTRRPYRLGVGAVLFDRRGRVFVARRIDTASEAWQLPQGGIDSGENPRAAVLRELKEETGLGATGLQDAGLTQRYAILPQWRQRYAPGVQENIEHVYFLALPAESDITFNPVEHSEYGWYSFEAAAAKVVSWTNREAILKLKA